MKDRILTVIQHVVGWIIFLSIPHSIFRWFGHGHHAPAGQSVHGPPHSHFFSVSPSIAIFNIALIAFYYFNSFVLIPNLLGKRKRIWYSVSIVFCMVVIVSLPAIISSLFPMHYQPMDAEQERQMSSIRILVTTLLFAIVFIISTGIRIVKEWYEAELDKEQIQLEKTTAELSFLKAQINPHFLFNTLNNIYSLAVKKSETTPEAVLLLADMMRYVLSDAQNNYVPLKSETDYLSKFIDLQRIRLTDKVTIDYLINGDTDSNVIAPLILVPYIENAFKFGISTHESSTISIYLDIHKNLLKLTVVNKLFPQTHLIAKSSGIGLINGKRRLALLYPEKYNLDINPNKNGNYIVDLEINLSI
jgi:two-component system LytT family sensor kinase